MNAYEILKGKHQKEVNELPIFFAFSNEQFDEEMKKLGLKPHETDKIYEFKNIGGFYFKTDAEKIFGIFKQHEDELRDAIANDKTGDGFIYDMFYTELWNHEFTVDYSTESTLDSLDLTDEMVKKDPRLKHGLAKAIAEQKRRNMEGY